MPSDLKRPGCRSGSYTTHTHTHSKCMNTHTQAHINTHTHCQRAPGQRHAAGYAARADNRGAARSHLALRIDRGRGHGAQRKQARDESPRRAQTRSARPCACLVLPHRAAEPASSLAPIAPRAPSNPA